MAKIKNKKRKTADQVHGRKEAMQAKKSMNPFEIHVNKEKMRVLGKKNKNDRGLPGVSRAKAIEKRKHTLLQEYKVANKSNKFMDKRIGERNKNMTEEDKVMARFSAVRVKAHNKKSIFNLADDEVLTHKGQTLSEIEKFEDPRSDDEDNDYEQKSGNLEKDFVGDAHFGGGLFRKTGKEGAKTHKELIDQLIAESKKRKAEKQKTKEATLELTEKLDSEWKDLMPLINKNKKTEEDRDKESTPKVDDYDKVMRELRFEARGTVSDRLKTEDEIAKEEKEKLEKLEKERLDRMQGFVEEKSNKPTHRSADDLDDDFVYESDPEYMLSYNNEGESNVKVDATINGKSIGDNEDNSDEENDEGDEEEAEGEEEDQEEESEEEPDNLSDLKESDGENEDLEDEKPKTQTVKKLGKITEKFKEEARKNDTIILPKEETFNTKEMIQDDLQKRKEIMEKARNELPFTFSLPDSYEDLQKTFENQSSNHQCVILERMIKCNHPSLSAGNKENLGVLFAYILQHLNDIGSEATNAKSIKECFNIFNAIVPQIYELAQLNPDNAHNSLREVLKEKHEEYKKSPKKYPGLELLLFFKLVSILFSTSDFRHQVITPCFIFMEQMLNKCKVQTQIDISYGLFLCTLILEYTSLSKRYLPAVVNFLGGILHMTIPKTSVKLIKVSPPFKSTSSHLVLVEDKSKKTYDNLKLSSADLLDSSEITEDFQVRAFYNTVKLIEEFVNNLKDLSSNVEIFQGIANYLKLVKVDKYPKVVKEAKLSLEKLLENNRKERKLEFIVMEAKKPKALRLYEPKIVEIYDGKKFKVQSREKAARDKMLHKLKKEQKGALREIRRDKSFLGRVKISQKLQSDKERKDKVKRIFSEANIQQSELNAIDRKKKRK
ncbi:unnamed protein product [Brassicogethes aeneus]|uniref:Nucleolar protein 14 homolog n=1 Tax=Brassicogethes aeneus TaxID=1431903 RepID=A0A9P0FIZ0_BRAAE|nr:unnamed protein product [Brassicogethes aeneus]